MPDEEFHYPDCNDLALGRLARAEAEQITGTDPTDRDLVHIAMPVLRAARTGVGLDQFREGCQCAKLYKAAADDYHRRFRKAVRAAADNGKSPFPRRTARIGSIG